MITRGFTGGSLLTRGVASVIEVVISTWREVKAFTVYIRQIISFNKQL